MSSDGTPLRWELMRSSFGRGMPLGARLAGRRTKKAGASRHEEAPAGNGEFGIVARSKRYQGPRT